MSITEVRKNDCVMALKGNPIPVFILFMLRSFANLLEAAKAPKPYYAHLRFMSYIQFQ